MKQIQRLVVQPDQIQSSRIQFNPEQHHYLYRVLRLKPGDCLIVFNGQGQQWLVALHPSEAKDTLQGQILEPIAVWNELPLAITLAVGLPKGNGMDDIVRQATELGVVRIIPIKSDRALLQPSPHKLERWRRIAQEAAEQSERQRIPTITEVRSFPDFLQDIGTPAAPRYLCVARHGSIPLITHFTDAIASHPLDEIYLTTGAEGGWTETEIEQAIAAGFITVSLGTRILRAVTAPIVALSWLTSALASSQSYHWGDR